jgi:hypothetical protein
VQLYSVDLVASPADLTIIFGTIKMSKALCFIVEGLELQESQDDQVPS